MNSQKKAPEVMVRDIKSLHLITQKALVSLTNKQNDNVDDKKIGFHNFKSNSQTLFVTDHSDYPVGYNNFSVNQNNKGFF